MNALVLQCKLLCNACEAQAMSNIVSAETFAAGLGPPRSGCYKAIRAITTIRCLG